MDYQTIIIILLIFNILLAVDAWWLSKQCRKAEQIIKELEQANNRQVVPIAEIKAEWSETDMKKIREIVNDIVERKASDEKANDNDEKTECNHLYDSVCLTSDVVHCCDNIVFRCGYCGHKESLPVKYGIFLNGFENIGLNRTKSDIIT